MNKTLVVLFLSGFLGLSIAFVLNQRSLKELKGEREIVYRVQGVIVLFHEFSINFNSAQIHMPSFDTMANRNIANFYSSNINAIFSNLKKLRSQVIYEEQQQRIDSLDALMKKEYNWVVAANVSDTITLGTENEHVNNIINIQNLTGRGINYADSVLNNRKLILEQKVNVTEFYSLFFGYASFLLIVFSLIFGIKQSKKRETTENFLASVLNTSLNGIISSKAIRSKDGKIKDFKIIYANDEIESHNGKKPFDIIGKNYQDIFPAAVSSGVFERQLKVLDSGEVDIYEINYENNDPDGWFKVKLSRNGDGLTASFINISDIKKFEEQLKVKIVQLEQSNQELEQFAYVASHDLQEPLRKIQTFADLVNKRNVNTLDKPSVEYISRIIASANRMSRLINDVLNYSRLAKTGQLIKNADLNKILEDVLVDFELLIAQKNAKVTREKLPPIEAYSLQMNQLFYNLINNSLKFSLPGVPPFIEITSVELSTEQVRQYPSLDERLSYVSIVFKDNGIGFSPEYSHQIFTIFKRLHNGDYTGSGIGLALCKKIATNHHGDIYAVSEPNKGSSFYVMLPIKQPAGA